MTPEDFSARYPDLYHLTRPESLPLIRQFGLLSPLQLCDLFNLNDEEKDKLLSKRRPKSVVLTHTLHGTAVIHDNAPLSEKALGKCLDDGLAPKDWLHLLNERTFFFTKRNKADALRAGPAHKNQQRSLLVIDTETFLRAHIERVTISPFNTGSTIHTPARRGNGTFARLSSLDYEVWRRSRPTHTPDVPKEVSIVGGVRDIFNYVSAIETL